MIRSVLALKSKAREAVSDIANGLALRANQAEVGALRVSWTDFQATLPFTPVLSLIYSPILAQMA